MRATELRGVIPANLLPLHADLEVDEASLRDHLEWLLGQPVGGITCNAHASEIATLSRAERQRCLAFTVETVAARVPVVCGVYADSTRQAVEIARDAERGGADALLVFPSALFAEQRLRRGEMVLAHFAAVADATGLPLVVFEYRRSSGCHYGPEMLLQLVERIPSVAAIKEWSLDILDFEANLRAIRGAARPVSVLSSFSNSLLASLVLGADGVLSGHGSLVADMQCELFAAVARGDLAAARRVNDRLFGLTRVFYADPFQDAHNRMKFALHALGRIRSYAVRPPLQPLREEEKVRVTDCLVEAGLLARGDAGATVGA